MTARAAVARRELSGAVVTLESVERELCRRSLATFVRMAWDLVEPSPLSWNWHLDELCSRLTRITLGEIRRAVLNVPPGTGKSLFVSVFWPAWEWAFKPALRYLTAAYTDHNTIRDNRRLRAIVTSDWYVRTFWQPLGVSLASDQSAKVRFDTTAGGWRIATSVGGAGTGEHPDRIIIDDPHKALEAPSEVARQAVGDWFETTLSTRKARDPAIVLIMQRLHEDDLAGRLLGRGGWDHLLLPMRYELPESEDGESRAGRWDCPCHAEGPDPADRRTEPGELLWPELWPEDKVREEELDLGPFGTSGQLQQRPVPPGGGFYKREWFAVVGPLVEKVPSKLRECRGWDTAATPDGGDWTVGVKISEAPDGTLTVEDVVRAQVGPAAVDALIRQTAEMDGKQCMVREEQEPGSSGKAVITARRRALRGFDYAGVRITGDKITRNRPFRAQAEAGCVQMRRGEWNAPYLESLCSFPVGKHDDDADATSCAYNALVAERRQTSAVW